MPIVLCHMDFVFATSDLAITEHLMSDEVSRSAMERTTLDSAFYGDCDDIGCAPELMNPTAAITAVDPLGTFSDG